MNERARGIALSAIRMSTSSIAIRAWVDIVSILRDWLFLRREAGYKRQELLLLERLPEKGAYPMPTASLLVLRLCRKRHKWHCRHLRAQRIGHLPQLVAQPRVGNDQCQVRLVGQQSISLEHPRRFERPVASFF